MNLNNFGDFLTVRGAPPAGFHISSEISRHPPERLAQHFVQKFDKLINLNGFGDHLTFYLTNTLVYDQIPTNE